MAGCDQMSPSDRQFFEERNRERSERIARLRAVNENVTTETVINRVKSNPADDGDGTTEEWLTRQIQNMKGQIMFPRWTATRRGSNKQEVVFDFVFIDAQNRMRRIAYKWDVDVLDMTVSEARITQLEEIQSPEQSLDQQQRRRVREHERLLE
jgi:hypothetical protein